MNKKEWFKEKLFVDIYGRAPNLSDVPMTMMTRSEVFKKRGLTRKEINKLWNEYSGIDLNRTLNFV